MESTTTETESSTNKNWSLDAIRAAQLRIAPFVARTPLLRFRLRADCELFLKAESLQPTGSFKLRGAFSCLTRLPARTEGVVTHSSGNHAQAVARAARILGLRAVVVMPTDAPAIKRQRTEADGAEIVSVAPDSEARRECAERIANERGFELVPPYDDDRVAQGQGTAALEIIDEISAVDQFYCPVSGGGLLSGCATVIADRFPRAEIIGVEPLTGNDTEQSLMRGLRVMIDPPNTIADGLKVRIPGRSTFPVLQRLVTRIALVSDPELRNAIAWALTHLRLILEPSGAAGLAAALREGRGRCAVLLSGGNIEPRLLAEILQSEPTPA